MTALYRPPSGGFLLLLVPLAILGAHYAFEIYLADACLDRGGSFDYVNWACSTTEQFAYSPYLQRHWGKTLVLLSLSLSGLIVIALNYFKKR